MKALLVYLLFGSALLCQSPVFRSETRVVEVPLVARDRRNAPVNDLTIGDLRLFDNGAEQTILTLDKLAAPKGGAAEAPDDASSRRLGPRLSIVVVDQLNTALPDQIRGQLAIAAMLKKLPQNHERMGFFVLSDRLNVLCDFTTDNDILRTLFGKYEVEQLPIGATPAPLSVGPSSGFGRSPQTPGGVEARGLAEQRLAITRDAFGRIARRLKGLPGEKTLIWVTSGFPPPDVASNFSEVVQQLRDAKVTVYPVDARGLVPCLPLPCPASVTLPIEMMDGFAMDTGGRAYHDNNGLAALIRAALDESRHGYLLTYTPNNFSADGLQHKVELQTSRKAIDLRYRSGYTAGR